MLNTHVRDNLNDLDRRTSPVGDYVGTSESTTSTTFTDLTTVGPSVGVTIGTSGKAIISLSARMWSGLTDGLGNMSCDVNGATTLVALDEYGIEHCSTTANIDIARQGVTTLFDTLNAGGQTFTAKYRTQGGGNTSAFANRRLLVTPLGS